MVLAQAEQEQVVAEPASAVALVVVTAAVAHTAAVVVAARIASAVAEVGMAAVAAHTVVVAHSRLLRRVWLLWWSV